MSFESLFFMALQPISRLACIRRAYRNMLYREKQITCLINASFLQNYFVCNETETKSKSSSKPLVCITFCLVFPFTNSIKPTSAIFFFNVTVFLCPCFFYLQEYMQQVFKTGEGVTGVTSHSIKQLKGTNIVLDTNEPPSELDCFDKQK